MALYATIADLEGRVTVSVIAQVSGAAQGQPAYDVAATTALTRASALIDSYAAARYKTPLVASEQLEGLCVDVASYELLKTKRLEESERQGYADAVRFLKDLARGLVTLDQPAGEDPQAPAGGATEVLKRKDEEYVFSNTNLDGF